MKNNLSLWANHYEDILIKYYEDFSLFLESHNEPVPEYKDFVIFVYKNTKKTILKEPGMFSKELRAPII
jgi:hypothetical protein